MLQKLIGKLQEQTTMYLILGAIIIASFFVKVVNAMVAFGEGTSLVLFLELLGADIVFVILMIRLARSFCLDSWGVNERARSRSKLICWGFSLGLITINLTSMFFNMSRFDTHSQIGVYPYVATQSGLITEIIGIILSSAKERVLMR